MTRSKKNRNKRNQLGPARPVSPGRQNHRFAGYIDPSVPLHEQVHGPVHQSQIRYLQPQQRPDYYRPNSLPESHQYHGGDSYRPGDQFEQRTRRYENDHYALNYGRATQPQYGRNDFRGVHEPPAPGTGGNYSGLAGVTQPPPWTGNVPGAAPTGPSHQGQSFKPFVFGQEKKGNAPQAGKSIPFNPELRPSAHRGGFKPPSSRPLMATQRPRTPEKLLGMDGGKIFDLDKVIDLTKSDKSDSDDGMPVAKRAKTEFTAANVSSANEVPKWTNADPSIAMAAPDEAKEPKANVLQMIREAKKDGALPKTAAAGEQNFIAFDATSPTHEEELEEPVQRRAPKTLKGNALRNDKKRTFNEMWAQGPAAFEQWNAIVPDWRGDETPWFDPSNVPKNAPTSTMLSQLHFEVCDFFNWIAPRTFEKQIRKGIIGRLQKAISKWLPGAIVEVFGSFASGIFLPNSDMDLVVLSKPFQHSGLNTVPANRGERIAWFSSLANQFRQCRTNPGMLAKPGSVATIALAKVPIIKYVDQLTGVSVDVSFDNVSGIKAIENYSSWQMQYLDMPVYLLIVKQYLLMRGMNDVSIGGLGGFSITCMVVNFLQQWEPMNGGPVRDLGQFLLQFFDYYGNRFDSGNEGIRMASKANFNKLDQQNDQRYRHLFKGPVANRAQKLTIVDPNNASNDLSGGSNQWSKLREVLAKSHAALQTKMEQAKNGPTQSVLGVLLKGDYLEQNQQRAKMRSLCQGYSGKALYTRPICTRSAADIPPFPIVEPTDETLLFDIPVQKHVSECGR
ncbi:MAG: hypothetical protein M1831_000844 [Alyxoria varia]|nr:MAG: hypothetical protein M1831_000844 [Alyxoria varia]